jgi:hypothetical protein
LTAGIVNVPCERSQSVPRGTDGSPDRGLIRYDRALRRYESAFISVKGLLSGSEWGFRAYESRFIACDRLSIANEVGIVASEGRF